MRTANSMMTAGVCLALLGACGDPAVSKAPPVTGTSPVVATAQAVDDAVLSTRVKTALIAESSVSGGDITVSSERGQVTLTGSVPPEQIKRADAIVRKVQGVQKVINALTPLRSSS